MLPKLVPDKPPVLRHVCAALVAVLMSTTVAMVVQAPTAYADAAGKGGDFVSLSPSVTVLNTRSDVGGLSGVRGPRSTSAFPVLGVGAIPSVGVSSVLVDITAIGPTASTYLGLWPDGQPWPGTSMVNAKAGDILSNSAVVPVGANGRIALYNRNGDVHVQVDVQGYFTTSSGGPGGGFVPVDHTSVVDTRTGLGTPTGAIPAGGSRTVTFTGGVVPTGTAAVFVDAIVTGATAVGFLRAYPSDAPNSASLLDFVSGTTSGGIAVKLAANGQATFVNRSGAPIHLVITVEGYFSASSSVGAGMRPLVGVALFDTRTSGGGSPVPANGTIDVQVGGTNGLPTRGIAAAALNLVVTGQTANGFLNAWPLDGTNPGTSLTNFAGGAYDRAGLAVVKVGTEGKIRIRNNSSGTVHIHVVLEGWFADPLPNVSVAQNSRVSAMQLTPTIPGGIGTIEYAYVDNLGRVRYAHQSDPDRFEIQWTVLSGNEAFTGPPTISQLADGRVQLTAQHTDSNVQSISQTTAGGPAWNAWSRLGGSVASPPVAGKLSDGTVVLFALDVDGRLWVYAQSGSSPYWRSLGETGLVGPVTVSAAQDGLRIVGIDNAGAVKTAVYRNDSTFSAWTGLGGSGLNSAPAVVVYPGYRARIFVRAADGTIVTKVQDASGTFSASWQPVGDFTAVGSPSAILDPALARTAVVARGPDNRINIVWETGQGTGVWGSWGLADGRAVVSDPTVLAWTYSGGQSWLILARNINDELLYAWRSDPSSVAASGVQRAGETIPFVTGTLPGPPDVR